MGFLGLATSAEVDALARQMTAMSTSMQNSFTMLVGQNALLIRQQDIIITILRQIGAGMATFEEAITDLASVTNEMADELDRREVIIAELTSALANGEVQRAQALAEQASAHTAAVEAISARLRGLGEDAENPVPDTTPLPVPPDTGTPVPGDETSGDGSGEALDPVDSEPVDGDGSEDTSGGGVIDETSPSVEDDPNASERL